MIEAVNEKEKNHSNDFDLCTIGNLQIYLLSS